MAKSRKSMRREVEAAEAAEKASPARKKKATKKKKATRKKSTTSRARRVKDVAPRRRLVWVVYSSTMREEGRYLYHERDKAEEKLEQLLSGTFERVHKSYLVKMSEVKEIIVASGSKYSMALNNGDLIPIGRTKYKELKAKWF